MFIPFRVQEIYHENGVYYGQNVISKNMIIANRRQLLNGNSFILGVSGGGKSFAAKGEIINQVLSSDADIIIIDPEREYSQLVNAISGMDLRKKAGKSLYTRRNLFCCGYAPYFMEGIKLRYPEYCRDLTPPKRKDMER